MRDEIQAKLDLIIKDIEQVAINHHQLLGAKAICEQLLSNCTSEVLEVMEGEVI